jgi:3-dehydroquinate synthase
LEAVNGMENYYHGECVSIGMVPMCSEKVRKRLLPVLKKLNLPYSTDMTADMLIDAVKHDKKMSGDNITVVYVQEIGASELVKMTVADYEEKIRKVLG